MAVTVLLWLVFTPFVVQATEPAILAGELNLIRDFHAAGDGRTDDTAALQAFLDSCGSTLIRCYIPPGTYLYGGAVLDTTSKAAGMVIYGAGAGSSVLKLRPGTKGHALTIRSGGGYGNQSRPKIGDLTIDGSGSGLDGIHFEGPAGLQPASQYAQGADLRDITVKFAGRDGLYIGAGVNAGQTFNLWIAHPGRNAVTIDGGADWRFMDSQFYGAQRAGIAITGVTDTSGAVRLRTARPHGLQEGMVVGVWGTNGTAAPVGLWPVHVVDDTHLDLRGSHFASTWANNGWIIPIFVIDQVRDDGAHGIRIRTKTPHGFATGQQVFIRDVAGAPANGHWEVTVVDDRTVDLDNSRLSKPWTGGGTMRPATFGVAIRSPASNFFTNCTLYGNMIALSETSNSGNIFKFTGGEINGNWMGGVSIATRGMPVPNTLQNVQFASNSLVSDGSYSDILLMNTGATSIVGNQFVRSGHASRFLVERQSLTADIVWLANAYSEADFNRPYAASALGESGSGPLGETVH